MQEAAAATRAPSGNVHPDLPIVPGERFISVMTWPKAGSGVGLLPAITRFDRFLHRKKWSNAAVEPSQALRHVEWKLDGGGRTLTLSCAATPNVRPEDGSFNSARFASSCAS